MTLNAVLNDWRDYDEKKIRNEEDPKFFSCDEPWEIFYLKNKIKELFPFINELKIFEAIETSGIKTQCTRKEFVEAVLLRLGIS